MQSTVTNGAVRGYMPFNELRKDYLLDRWVVIATERGRRPTDFSKQERSTAKTGVCPMEPGNEHMTPPAILVYVKSGSGIKKARDTDDRRVKNWLIRVVPNLYPAFSPPSVDANAAPNKQSRMTGRLEQAVGHHEVLVESPDHNEDPAAMPLGQLVYVVNGYLDRLRELSSKPYVKYVSIFRNHGLEAGASLSHAHSQIIATPMVPSIVAEESTAAKKFWKENKRCVFCDIIKKEKTGARFVTENSAFSVIAPYASVNPMEFWIFPKKHQSNPLEMSDREIRLLAEMLKSTLAALKSLVNDPPYNFGFHLLLEREARAFFHWHLEVYPRLAVWAGFEKSTGVYINTMTPETAAESYRRALSELTA